MKRSYIVIIGSARRGGSFFTMLIFVMMLLSTGLMYYYFQRTRSLERQLYALKNGEASATGEKSFWDFLHLGSEKSSGSQTEGEMAERPAGTPASSSAATARPQDVAGSSSASPQLEVASVEEDADTTASSAPLSNQLNMASDTDSADSAATTADADDDSQSMQPDQAEQPNQSQGIASSREDDAPRVDRPPAAQESQSNGGDSLYDMAPSPVQVKAPRRR